MDYLIENNPADVPEKTVLNIGISIVKNIVLVSSSRKSDGTKYGDNIMRYIIRYPAYESLDGYKSDTKIGNNIV